MSGHGGFSIIGGGNRPQPIELPTVGDLKPDVDKLGALNIETKPAEPDVADTRLDQANRVSAKLDALLLKAAKSVAKGVDAEALKTTTAALQKGARKAIDKAAAKAEAAFKEIGKFSGRQIAAALVKDSKGIFDWNGRNPVGKAIRAALDAQAKLSDELAKAINALPKDTPAAVQSALDEAMFRNDRRASEIQALVCDFADKAERAGDDPETPKRLDKTLASLVPAQSIKMHGSEKIASDFRISLASLARRIDNLAAGKERQLSGGEAASIRRQIDEAANALAKAERDHAAKGTPLDPELFGAAKDVLAKFKARLVDIKRSVAIGALNNFVAKTFSPPSVPILHPKFAPLFKMLFPALGATVETQRRLRVSALEFVENPAAENREKMDALATQIASLGDDVKQELTCLASGASAQEYDLGEFTDQQLQMLTGDLPEAEQNRCPLRLISEFRGVLKSFMANPEPTTAAMKIAYGGSKGIATQTVHLAEMRRTLDARDASQFLTGKTLDAAFEGMLAVTTLVETRLSGLPDEDADPALDGSNATHSRPLGSGAVNTVYEVGFKDGSTWIFKPEASGRQALEKLNLSKGAYKNQLLVAQLNMAAQRTADALGLDDVMTKTSVGAHGGEFGLFMEKAPGVEADNFGKPRHPSGGCMSASQIRGLDNAQYAKVVGGLMRKCNRLEWFDLITGQGDRHGKNYLVEVNGDGTSTVKGIDNDACFGKFMIGPGLFRLQGKQAEYFINVLKDVKKIFAPNASKGQSRFETDPGIHTDSDGSIWVDVSKIKSQELFHCLRKGTGCHSMCPPDYIDKELYYRLVALEGGKAREDYIAALRLRLSEDQVQVAIQRLDGAIQHAKALNEKNCVVATADWENPDVQRKVAGSPRPLPQYNGTNKAHANYAAKVAKSVKSTVCLFRRDLLRSIAKPGWFEE
jgi:hypothetical protein